MEGACADNPDQPSWSKQDHLKRVCQHSVHLGFEYHHEGGSWTAVGVMLQCLELSQMSGLSGISCIFSLCPFPLTLSWDATERSLVLSSLFFPSPPSQGESPPWGWAALEFSFTPWQLLPSLWSFPALTAECPCLSSWGAWDWAWHWSHQCWAEWRDCLPWNAVGALPTAAEDCFQFDQLINSYHCFLHPFFTYAWKIVKNINPVRLFLFILGCVPSNDWMLSRFVSVFCMLSLIVVIKSLYGIKSLSF